MTDSTRKRKLDAPVGSLPNLRMGEPRPDSVPGKIKHIVAKLSGIVDPLSEVKMKEVRRHVRALLEICKNEDNLDDAANEGAMNVIIPLLKSINGGDDNALNFPKTLYVVWRGRRGLRRPAVRIFVAALVDGS
ncbi:hypothetical protein H632_c1314p1 [Helicosporidium sp. ATCC 50920]|nr:hypothetical protein H632_c1314p1 [Helicosporidium sp. ATCC 50920]|eukprot:KDD74438.1 hypothetical protein H632_c1314p1 [Helicosporidium sp. ATCC 50920]